MNADFPGQPAILRNIALARSCLAMPKAHEAWHAHAVCPDVDFDQAVESESLAQLMTYEVDQARVALVNWTVNVSDANALNEQMLSSKSLVAYTGDMSEFREEDSPPPKSVFMVLDRPVPGADDEITALNVPRAAGHDQAVWSRDRSFRATGDHVAQVGDLGPGAVPAGRDRG